MKFRDSGLPNNKLLEDAFNHSYQNLMGLKDEMLKDMQQQLHMGYAQRLAMLDADKKAGICTPEQYTAEKGRLDKFLDEQMKLSPQMVDEDVKQTFLSRRLGPAKELAKHSTEATPETLAAILLIDCVRSPVDYLDMCNQFGPKIGDIIASIVHIDAYPATRAAKLSALPDDSKRIYMTLLATSLEGIIAQVQHFEKVAKANPGIQLPKLVFPAGQEETLFANAKALWNVDKGLDQHFMATFNRAAEATTSLFRMEVSNDGGLDLIKDTNIGKKTPNPKDKPPGPNKNGKSGLGDDIF